MNLKHLVGRALVCAASFHDTLAAGIDAAIPATSAGPVVEPWLQRAAALRTSALRLRAAAVVMMIGRRARR